MAASSQSSTKTSKTSVRKVFSGVLRHLAPQVEVNGSAESNAANRSFVFIARSH